VPGRRPPLPPPPTPLQEILEDLTAAEADLGALAGALRRRVEDARGDPGPAGDQAWAAATALRFARRLAAAAEARTLALARALQEREEELSVLRTELVRVERALAESEARAAALDGRLSDHSMLMAEVAVRVRENQADVATQAARAEADAALVADLMAAASGKDEELAQLRQELSEARGALALATAPAPAPAATESPEQTHIRRLTRDLGFVHQENTILKQNIDTLALLHECTVEDLTLRLQDACRQNRDLTQIACSPRLISSTPRRSALHVVQPASPPQAPWSP
jgi:hypothetical protein